MRNPGSRQINHGWTRIDTDAGTEHYIRKAGEEESRNGKNEKLSTDGHRIDTDGEKLEQEETKRAEGSVNREPREIHETGRDERGRGQGRKHFHPGLNALGPM